MKKKLTAILLSMAMCFCFAACGDTTTETLANDNTPNGTTTPANNNTPAPENNDPTTPAETNPFEGLSGVVYVYMPSPAPLADKLSEGFEALTGVKVEVFQGTTGEILARLEAESANPIADVVILASWSDGLALREEGGLLSYTPGGADKMHKTWIDSQNVLYGMSASAVGVVYNTTLIPALSADWNDLANADYAGELAFPDPERSGSAKDFLAGYINKYGETNGWATWEALAANGMTVPGANAAALEAVTTGEKSILVGAVDWNVYTSINRGEPLAFYYPASGTVINPRPAMILETSSNLDNAKAFMDYLLTDEAQQLIAAAYLIPGRSDITSTLRPNIAEMNVLDVDWDWMMSNATEISQNFNALMG
ncbi:MAG: ABC transporter substrate-binding protein [Oscillospiraceae bacterium]|jgi:iron(III) transport system substrate-binding protein|nr:ABC transporter substrate-binding protein [Oscillospiraceae bacterium]